MVARLGHLQARALPHGWLDLARQVAFGVVGYLFYSLVRVLVAGSPAAAFENARGVIQLERTLHVFVEPSIQTWAYGSHLVMGLSSWIYLNAQTSITIGGLLYLYFRRNGSFYFVRNMFAVAMLIALVGYAVFPTAPPRFLPEWGGPTHPFIDSVGDITHIQVGHASAAMDKLFNPYAAIPSMHVAFAIMIGWPLASLARSRAVAVLWRLYPLLIAFVIIATANHFIIDALLGALTAGFSAWVASRLARLRPGAWRFSPVTAGAGG
jgi:hypothetical protein